MVLTGSVTVGLRGRVVVPGLKGNMVPALTFKLGVTIRGSVMPGLIDEVVVAVLTAKVEMGLTTAEVARVMGCFVVCLLAACVVVALLVDTVAAGLTGREVVPSLTGLVVARITGNGPPRLAGRMVPGLTEEAKLGLMGRVIPDLMGTLVVKINGIFGEGLYDNVAAGVTDTGNVTIVLGFISLLASVTFMAALSFGHFDGGPSSHSLKYNKYVINDGNFIHYNMEKHLLPISIFS